ncbi:unnamed protein product [Clonostachys solani]|uniref:CHAT domain-containing protein n=1 Tax=Clonostachys solani TaxID=160281 RepID=A0A9P0EK80_9HYPO|nr:unnamed protein product [Clonostachys solani]
MPTDHPRRSIVLEDLGSSYSVLFRITRALDYLEKASQLSQEVVDHTPQNHPERVPRLLDAGIDHMDIYSNNGDSTHLELALGSFSKALDAAKENHPRLHTCNSSLAIAFRYRFFKDGNMLDLDAAIQHFEQAIHLVTTDHHKRVRWLQDVGACYGERFRKTQDIADFSRAIERVEESLETADDLLSRARGYSILGSSYGLKSKQTGAMQDLDLSIQMSHRALAITPRDSPDRTRRLHILGACYGTKYDRLGIPKDLDICIERYREALDDSPHDSSDRGLRLCSLGGAYLDRYQRFKAWEDLSDAIDGLEEAIQVAVTPSDHPDRARRIHSLGIAFQELYLGTGKTTDFVIAVQYLKDALNLTPADDCDRPARFDTLGSIHHHHYKISGETADLLKARDYYHEALQITPADHPDEKHRLGGVATCHHDLFLSAGSLADIDLAIDRYRKALELTPRDSPMGWFRLHNLGMAYRDRYRKNKDAEDLEAAIQHYQAGLDHPTAFAADRLKSGQDLLIIYADTDSWTSGCEIAWKTLSLVPLITPDALRNSDKQALLVSIVGLSSIAASVALMANKSVFDTISLLELGRGIIIGSLHDMQTDVLDLRQGHSNLAEEYIKLQEKLHGSSALTSFDERYKAGQQYEILLQKIRDLPGFSEFLLFPAHDDIKAAAASGPIVIINVSTYRCDALLIERHQLSTLPLPDLCPEDISVRATTLASLSTDTLEWLWDTVTRPVLEALRLDQAPGDSWPRIWWIPTGPLTSFPLHAAGNYNDGIFDTVLEHVISSYSSSLKEIINSRRRNKNRDVRISPKKVVLVGMEETPGQSRLEFASQEVEQIAKLCNFSQFHVSRPENRREDVLAQVNGCDIFHFAGHGMSNLSNPLKSSLLLCDGPLTVSRLLETDLRIQRPFLAYLSACGTGQVKQRRLEDEGIHLMSACQVAGFQHAIGSLWEVNDESCVHIAMATYEWILEHNLSNDSVSEGLHHACRKLRHEWMSKNSLEDEKSREPGVKIGDKDPYSDQDVIPSLNRPKDARDILYCGHSPLLWVPYVHYGV